MYWASNVGIILVLGLFNRITFCGYAIVMGVYYIFVLSKMFVHFTFWNCAMSLRY